MIYVLNYRIQNAKKVKFNSRSNLKFIGILIANMMLVNLSIYQNIKEFRKIILRLSI